MENEPKIEEQVTWSQDNNRCTVTQIDEHPVRNEKGEVIGKSRTEMVVISNRKELEEGLGQVLEMYEKEEKALQDLERQEATLGKKPVKDGDVMRVQKALETIHRYEQFENIEKKRKEILRRKEQHEKFLTARRKLIGTKVE